MQRQKEFINDAGASVIMTITEHGQYSTLTVEHEDYNGEGGPVHEQDASNYEMRKIWLGWIEILRGLKFRPV